MKVQPKMSLNTMTAALTAIRGTGKLISKIIIEKGSIISKLKPLP